MKNPFTKLSFMASHLILSQFVNELEILLLIPQILDTKLYEKYYTCDINICNFMLIMNQE